MKLLGRERPALLPYNAMSTELRHDFDTGDLQLEDELYVEVTSTDHDKNKICLKDVLAPDEEGDQTAPAAA